MRLRDYGIGLLGCLAAGCSFVIGLDGDPAVSGNGSDDGGVSTLCGNDNRDEGEVCDDGNTASGDGCRSDCKGVEICGDDLEDFGEDCDDGNMMAGDGCRADCTIELCGDGIADPGELCFGVKHTLTHEITPFSLPGGLSESSPPVVGDVNGDTFLDIALVSGVDGAALVYFPGSEDGSFGQPVEVRDEGLGAIHLVLADLDDSQGLDAYCQTAGNLYRFQNNGAGAFEAPVQTTLHAKGVQDTMQGIAVGEITGDSNADIAVISHNAQLETGTLHLLSGDGTLDPGSIATFDVGNGPRAIEVVDVNNDKLDDVVIVGSSGGATSELRILLSTGGGALSPQLPIALPDSSLGIASGDVDADGDIDLVVASQNAGPLLLRNNLGGGFEKTTLPIGFNNPGMVALGDLDGDGDLDLLGLDFGNNGSLTSYENDGNGEFNLGASWRLEDESGGTGGLVFFYSIEAVDLDGDGTDEPIVSWGVDMNLPSTPNSKSNIYVLEPVN